MRSDRNRCRLPITMRTRSVWSVHSSGPEPASSYKLPGTTGSDDEAGVLNSPTFARNFHATPSWSSQSIWETSSALRTPPGGLRLSHSNSLWHSCSNRLRGSPRRKATRKSTSPDRMRCIAARTCSSGRRKRLVKLATSASKTATRLATRSDAETTTPSAAGISAEVSDCRCDTHSTANQVAAMHIATTTETRRSTTRAAPPRITPLRRRTQDVVSEFDTGKEHVPRTPARLQIAHHCIRSTS